VVLFLFAFIVSGCSSSSDSTSSAQSNLDGASDENVDTELNPAEDAPTVTEEEPVNGETSIDVEDESVLIEPETQNTTQVFFEITVPEYQSNELRVVLEWADVNLSATWVGDEFWLASADLPKNTENVLSVTFYDNNGGIELARSSQEYRSSINDAETVVVGADQFNPDLFDADEDGINNLDELRAGSDPFIDEDSLLPIEDYTPSVTLFIQIYESFLTEDRPLFIMFAPHPNNPNQDSLSGSLDIDADGNGVLIHKFKLSSEYRNISGTRTYSEKSVSWEGDIRSYDGSDYSSNRSFTNTVTLVDEHTRKFIEESVNKSEGTYRFDWNNSIDLIGELIDGTSVCKPVAGTHFSVSSDGVRRTRTNTSISKEIDDPYWRVVKETEFFDRENEIETTEYFAQEFKFSKSYGNGQDVIGFPCDFVDFQP